MKDSKRSEKSLRKTIPSIKSRPSDKIALQTRPKRRPHHEMKGRPAKVKGQDGEHPRDHNEIATFGRE